MQLVKQTSSKEEIIDLRAYWSIVIKSKWKIITFSVFTTLLVAVFVAGMTPIYRSTASLLIKANVENTVSIDSVSSLDTSRKEYFLTQFEILKSRTVSEQVIDKLDLANNPEFMPDATPSFIGGVKDYVKSFFPAKDEDLVESALHARAEKVSLISNFQKRLSISPIRKTQVVQISFDTSDPALSADITNAVADVYISQELIGKYESTKNAAAWLKSRLEELRKNLEASISDLQAYRVKGNLIDIESKGVRSIAGSELESLTQSYLEAKKVRFKAETLSLFVKHIDKSDVDSLMSLPEISSNQLIKEIKKIEIDAYKNVSEASLRYGAKHPKLISAKTELSAVKEQLLSQVNKIIKGFSKDLKAAKDNERRFERELAKEKKKYQQITTVEQGYLKLKREVKANQSLYDTFLIRFKETSITTDLEVQQARILDRAEVPSYPSKPNKKLIVLLAFVASFGFAVILVFVLDALNDSFRRADEVESKLGVRLLGILPKVDLKKKEKLSLHAYFDERFRGFAESVRTIRTGFALSHLESEHQVVLVTSSVPNEGKTTTSVNLAFAMAQIEDTLLIEADMRRPSFTRVFDLPPYQIGLSNVISGTDNLDDAIFKDELSGLSVLSAGLIPPNPLELLSSDKFAKLLEFLKKKYTRIIIDSAPTQAVSDALVLAKQSDSIIYVVASEQTKQAIVKNGISRLIELETKIDGVILNKVNINKSGKGGFEGYYDYYEYNGKTDAS